MFPKVPFIFLLVLLILIFGCATKSKQASAPLPLEVVNISTDSIAWIRNFDSVVRGYRLSTTYPPLGYRECKMTSEIKETFLWSF
jgi:hypothetical protein